MFHALFINFAVLISLLFLLKQYFKKNPIHPGLPLSYRVMYGIGYGLIGMVLLFFTVPVAPNVYIDLRFIPIYLSCLYGGWIPALLTGAIIALGRVIFFPVTPSTLIALIHILVTIGGFAFITTRKQSLLAKSLLMMGLVYVENFYIFYKLVPQASDFTQFALFYAISLFGGGIVAFSFTQYIRQHQASIRELQIVKDQLVSFIEQSGDAIVITDKEFRVQKANSAFFALYGWSESEMLGKQLPDLIPNQNDLLEQVIEKIIPDKGVPFLKYETLSFNKDGQSRYITVTVSGITDENGQLIGYNGISHDLTERKRMEEELKTTKEQLESFIYHSPDPIAFFNMERRITKVNPAYEKVFGWTEQELMGNISPIIPPSEHHKVYEMFDRAQQGEATVEYEATRIRQDGAILNMISSVFLIRDGKGEPIGFSLAYRDITERKRTEELLRRSEKLSIVAELAAGIAHEIRNPLTTLKGFIQFMPKDQTNGEYFEIMKSEIDRIETITSEFLLLAKPQSTRFKLGCMNGVVEKVVAFLTPQANLKNFHFKVDLESALPKIMIEENHLKQLFINLIKNAMESMPHGGSIEIQTKRECEHVVIQIRDQGEGMTPEQVARLGEPFYSLKEKGTGLGLTICHKIVQEHGGTLSFQSKRHMGTLVEIRFPLKQVSD